MKRAIDMASELDADARSNKAAATEELPRESDPVSVYLPAYRARGSIMVFAMHYAPRAVRVESDTLRIKALLEAGYSVASVDQWGAGDTVGHISMHFAHRRAMDRLVRDYPLPQMLILDYFWLETNYYEEAYGTNWAKKLGVLFDAPQSNLVAALLPIDAPTTRESSMRTQMRALKRDFSMLELTSEADLDLNPLVWHTKRIDAALAAIDSARVHQSQARRMSGYVAIFRSTVDEGAMRAWLAEFAERGGWSGEARTPSSSGAPEAVG